MVRRRGRRKEPDIADPATHPTDDVCLRVAARFLRISKPTVRARIDDGQLPALRDGDVCRIRVSDLVAYQARVAQRST